MRSRSGPDGNRGNRAAPVGDRGRRRAPGVAPAGAWVLALLGLATVSVAQSPFTQPPSRSGTFTLPSSPSAASPFTLPPSPGGRSTPPPRSGVLSPFAPTPSRGPTSTLPPAPPLPGAEGTRPPSGELPEMPEPPLPILEPSGETPTHTGKLPPKPAVLPPLSAAPTAPIPKVAPVLLRAGLTVTLRVCQLLPADGLSSGERLLNSRPPIQEGDCFLAEVVDPCPPYPVLVGGTVTKITGPGHFGRPGYVSLQMTQLVQTVEGQTGWVPWRMDLADRRFTTRMRRILLTTLLGLEGAGTGASIGAQFSGGNMAFIGGGLGIGALVGLGYASFQRGTEANLEPGDTFEIVVGTTQYRPVSREWQTILYPAADPIGGKLK